MIEWLAASPLSQLLGAHRWITPALQTVHIVAIAALMASVLVVDLRLLGVGGDIGSLRQVTNHYIGWVWRALVVLLLSGALLTVGEPMRELTSWVFYTKMALVLTASGLTALAQGPVRKAANASPMGRPRWSTVFAVVSLVLWVCVVIAGRWIAYV
jgi:hypothetical protein